MVLNVVSACLLAYSSDYGSKKISIDETESPSSMEYKFTLLDMKTISDVYNAYLYFMPFERCYISYLYSKDKDGVTVGWEILEYRIAERLFPMLKEHKKDYAEFISS